MQNAFKMAIGIAVLFQAGINIAHAGPDYELSVAQAEQIRDDGKVHPQTIRKDCFGPGVNGSSLYASTSLPWQMRWNASAIPEGDYYVGLMTLANGYLEFNESLAYHVQLLQNDTSLPWQAYTEPWLPENSTKQNTYQAEFRLLNPIHIKPGDILRVEPRCNFTVGPLRLYKDKPRDDMVILDEKPPEAGTARKNWLYLLWSGDPILEGNNVLVKCRIFNPGVKARKFTIKALAKDYWQAVLLDKSEDISIKPLEFVEKEFSFPFRPDSSDARLMLTLESPGETPIRSCKFHISDRLAGPRPRMYLNGSDWEMMGLPGKAEPGAAPPENAKWEKIAVPSTQGIKDYHCAWYRKTFAAPQSLAGERYVIQFLNVHCEAWIYLNGQLVAHQYKGAHPFEIDITKAFKPGAENQLLIAVRDWIAYSPINQERVTQGAQPIIQDGMVAPSGFMTRFSMGIGRTLWLEARPAVSVDDVAIKTSVRDKKIILKYRLKNTRAQVVAAEITPRIFSGDKEELALASKKMEIPANGTSEVVFEKDWPAPHLWSPEDPCLYVLKTDLKSDQGSSDMHRTRFGFREFWVDGISFYLNGIRRKLPSGWARCESGIACIAFDPKLVHPARRLENVYNRQIEALFNDNVLISRITLSTGVEECCDIADESGLLLKIEGEPTQMKFTYDEKYWGNVLKSNLLMMDAYKNHPSVVIWSAGNENMWGMFYQGDEARDFANKWQVKIAREMNAYDPEKRPVEWEADGDLLGKWNYHSLHYLFGGENLPNDAWLGKLDGKTVAKYCMGDIVLGEKPVSIGEALDVNNNPWGGSRLLGDQPFLGAYFWRKSHIRDALFVLNGYRDIEMVLIDTYVPQTLQKAQTIVLKNEDCSFYGGRTVARDINVHNDLPRRAKMSLRWRLASDGKTLDQGAEKMKLAPAELKRISISVKIPALDQVADASLRLDLYDGDKLAHTESRDWKISPAGAVRRPESLDLSVYDPPGGTAALLAKQNIPFTKVAQLNSINSKSLIIGVDALKNMPEGAWRQNLSEFVWKGGKILVLRQTQTPDFLPFNVTLSQGKKATAAFVRATDHPVLRKLTDGDMRWWPDDHYVSPDSYRKPNRGNYLPLLDAGTKEGPVESPLMEIYYGTGSILLCQLLIPEKNDRAPAAAVIWQNLLDYLAAPGCFRHPGKCALLAAKDSNLRKFLEELKVDFDDVGAEIPNLDPDKYPSAIVDAATGFSAVNVSLLKKYADAGGQILLHGATPGQSAWLNELAGVKILILAMENSTADCRYNQVRGPNCGMMSGISNDELFWASRPITSRLQEVGNGRTGVHTDKDEWIADFLVMPADKDRARVESLVRPGGALRIPIGKGELVLNQLRFDQCHPDVIPRAKRYASLLLTNLGVALKPEKNLESSRKKRFASYSFFNVPLSKWANRGLRADKEKNIVGWSDQDPNDMRELPTGDRVVLGGVPFRIEAGKGIIGLFSFSGSKKNAELPKEVRGIEVGRKAAALFFLHAGAYSAMDRVVFKYIVNYDDGQSLEIPIDGGRHIVDWWGFNEKDAAAEYAAHGMFFAWEGSNPMVAQLNRRIVLPCLEWRNPHPEKIIRNIDFVAHPENNFAGVYLLVAITGANDRPDAGEVTDVTGTDGIKVKFGDDIEEIRYIGVVGIKPEHQFYPEAVKRHRELLLGKKVAVRDDVVSQDPAGHRIAYVFLGESKDPQDMVNARMISRGLGKIGNFHGNDGLQAQFKNLEWIAGQNKEGVWGYDDKK